MQGTMKLASSAGLYEGHQELGSAAITTMKHAVNVGLYEGHQEVGSAAITTGNNKALYSIISIYLL